VRPAAILPVKRFEAAKQRLGEALGSGSRAALAAAMFADVLSALERSEMLQAIVVVSGEREVLHHVRPAGHGAARHPAGQDLPEHGEVGCHPGHGLHAPW